MSSQTLQIGDNPPSSSPSFVQQGQVDWVAFANSTVSASVSVMQRFSAAGVQPVTVAGGLALGSRFELGKKGTHNMDTALKTLNGVFGYGKLLYYGFGYRSFVNILAETKVGVNLVALCATLVDMHDIAFAAEVLAALWKLESFPDQFEPSMSQFTALVTACSGVIAATVFGQIGDMMLGDLRKILRLSSRSGLPRRSESSAQDVAKVLHGLFQISQGARERIQIIGGPSCSFVGAFAHWLLNFTVYVEDDSGTIIHADTLGHEAAQVRIRYSDMNKLSAELNISSTTYILRDYEMLFMTNETYEGIGVKARTSWDGCLKRAFWGSAERLINGSHILGSYLGSAARIFAALARGEADVGEFSRLYFGDFVDGAYGRGFIENVGAIFPELERVEHFEKIMLKAFNNSVEHALSNLQVAVTSLTDLCECGLCSGEATRCVNELQDECADTYCVLGTAMTIASLVRLVACLDIHEKLNPTISGLHLIYKQCDRRIHLNGRRRQSPLRLNDILCLHSLNDDNYALLSSDEIMAGAHCLFTGHPSEQSALQRTRTALSLNGICCYIEALHGPSSNASVLRRVRVLPGRILRGDREYAEVFDGPGPPFQFHLPRAKFSPTSVTTPATYREDEFEVKPLVEEQSNGLGLSFYYEAAFPMAVARIEPGNLTQRVLLRTGLIVCNRRTCKKDLAFPCRYIQDGWMLLDESFKEQEADQSINCLIWPFRESFDVGRCVAIQTALQNEDIFVRRDECLPCCTKTVVTSSERLTHRPFVVII